MLWFVESFARTVQQSFDAVKSKTKISNHSETIEYNFLGGLETKAV